MFGLLADAIVVLHVGFVLFVVCGGLLVIRWRRLAWVHLPAAAWGAWVEFAGWICPLTPLENWLREQGGRPAYASGFVEHYLVPLLYPSALSREVQWLLGAFVLVINIAVYAVILGRSHRRGRLWTAAMVLVVAPMGAGAQDAAPPRLSAGPLPDRMSIESGP